jgi:hypothetical protein
MKCNVGGIERSGCIVCGIALLLIGLFAPLEFVWRAVALTLAAIALVSAAARFCPLNAALGINICGTAKREGGK